MSKQKKTKTDLLLSDNNQDILSLEIEEKELLDISNKYNITENGRVWRDGKQIILITACKKSN